MHSSCPRSVRFPCRPKATGKPYFSFNLTVQSHGPYYTDAYYGQYEYLTGDYSDDVRLVNLALGADYFPFEDIGLYVGVSLADVFFPYGLDGDGKVRFSNHLRLGYAWNLPWTTLDLRVNLRDLVSASASDAYYLSSRIGQLGRISFTCLVSFRYDFASTSQEEMQ